MMKRYMCLMTDIVTKTCHFTVIPESTFIAEPYVYVWVTIPTRHRPQIQLGRTHAGMFKLWQPQ